MKTRLDQLRDAMRERDLAAFLISDRRNVRYLSGFTGSAGSLLVTPEDASIVTDFRYYQQAEQEAPDWTLVRQSGSHADAVGELLDALAGRLGFEADELSVSSWRSYQKHSPEGLEWVEGDKILAAMRAVKSADEIEAIRRAQAITDRVGEELPEIIRPGRSEAEIAWLIEQRFREYGADGPSFDIIVASGPNSALPHHHSGARVIGDNEIVLIDMGARLDGYHSDMTRTFFTGAATDEYRRVYALVHAALEATEATIRAGAGWREADAAARDLIAAAGHADDFGHGTGHGVGLQIHERPTLSPRSDEEKRLEPGNIVTVEPGVYLPGWGGIRIEDLVLVTEDGVEVLTRTPRDLEGSILGG